MAGDFRLELDQLALLGASSYLDAHPGIQDTQPRIYVKSQPDGVESFYLGLLDTGAHYCILAQEVVQLVRDHLTEPIGHAALRTAHGRAHGDLFNHRITLIGDWGEALGVEAVVFVSPDWGGSSFLGYTGVLDRIQFAIQPHRNRFLFGPI